MQLIECVCEFSASESLEFSACFDWVEVVAGLLFLDFNCSAHRPFVCATIYSTITRFGTLIVSELLLL